MMPTLRLYEWVTVSISFIIYALHDCCFLRILSFQLHGEKAAEIIENSTADPYIKKIVRYQGIRFFPADGERISSSCENKGFAFL